MELAQDSVQFLHQKVFRASCLEDGPHVAKSVRYALARVIDYDQFLMVEITKSTSKPPFGSSMMVPKIVFTINKPDRQ